jgi:S-formylglutathione hydrolase FrmB
MAICEFHTNQNNVLQKMTSFVAITPDDGDGPFPVFYLLHGLSDDHTAWTRRSGIENHVAGLPLIVVMPNGERGFYTDSTENPRAAYETNIVRDLIPFVDRTFRTIPARAGRVIAGLSMGGYGAFKLALKHPDLFCAAVSHSGAVGFGGRTFAADDDWGREWRAVLGPAPKGGPDDVFALAERGDAATRPALRLDCGVDDFLIEENRALHTHLDRLGIPHEYQEHPGEHNWAYWDKHVQDTLAFFKRVLKMGPKDPVAGERE